MKKAVTITLIFAYLTGVFQFTMPFLSYYSNYTYFSEVACINKNHPEKHCNGQCQLKRMIKGDHSSKKSASGHPKQIEQTSSSTIFFYEKAKKVVSPITINAFFNPSRSILAAQFIGDLSVPPPKLG